MTWRFDGGTSSSMQGAQFYADQAALKGLSHSTNQAEGVEKAAREFEGLFINLVFKSMREANAVFETDSVFNSRETNFYRDMLDSQLSAELARGGGIGLAQIMMRQMMPPDSVGLEAQSAQSAYHVTEPGITLDRARMVPGKASERASSETPGDTNATGSVFPNADTQALYGDAESLLSMRHQSDSAPVKTVQADPVDLSEPIDSPERFIEAVWSQAESAARQLNVDPGVLVAQAALETGWGKHIMSDGQGGSSHNLFGVKAGRATVARVTQQTTEYVNAQAQKEHADFRVYDSFASSFNDYVNLLKRNPRYTQALQVSQNSEAFVQALHTAGYATDPQYTTKVMQIYQGLPAKLARIVLANPETEVNSESTSTLAQRDA